MKSKLNSVWDYPAGSNMSTSTWKFELETEKAHLWAQIGVVFLLIELALWTVGSVQKIFSLVALVVIFGLTIANRHSPRELGIGSEGFWRATIAIPIAFLVAGGFLAVGAWAGTLRVLFGHGSVALHALGYAVWSIEQEFILNSFFYMLLERLLGNTHRTAFLAALLFSFAHIPNPILVPATLLGGWLFVEGFRRWRNIYPLGIAHAALGLSLAVTVPDPWMHHMRVGLSFFRFHI